MATITLTNSQVLILKTLLRNPNGLTREQITEKAQCVVDNTTLGPVYDETLDKHPGSLTSLRLVLRKKFTPDTPVIYLLSEPGKRAAQMYSARRIGAKDKVPAEVLNPVVLKIRPFKPYGIENFTDDDVKEIRAKLPEEHQEVTIDSLRRQIMNQRKIGAYKTDRYSEPEWYVNYRETNEFKVFAQKVEDLYQGCAVCMSEEARVYHRRFYDDGKSVVGMERGKDGIMLCVSCHNRNWKFLAAIPSTEPDSFNDSESEE